MSGRVVVGSTDAGARVPAVTRASKPKRAAATDRSLFDRSRSSLSSPVDSTPAEPSRSVDLRSASAEDRALGAPASVPSASRRPAPAPPGLPAAAPAPDDVPSVDDPRDFELPAEAASRLPWSPPL